MKTFSTPLVESRNDFSQANTFSSALGPIHSTSLRELTETVFGATLSRLRLLTLGWRRNSFLERFCCSRQFLKRPEKRLLSLWAHLIPIALVLCDLLKGTDVILCFRRRGLEIHSFPNRLPHDLCLMRVRFCWRIS